MFEPASWENQPSSRTMSLRHHRNDRVHKKYHKGRMPAPSEAKLGTRVHQTERYPEDDSELDVEKCVCCGEYHPVDELDNDFICEDCEAEEGIEGME